MGYVMPPSPPRLNVDRHGLPRDYATYVWMLYRRHVEDRSPGRQAFLHGTRTGSLADLYLSLVADLGQQVIYR